jgi:hypothetical protein
MTIDYTLEPARCLSIPSSGLIWQRFLRYLTNAIFRIFMRVMLDRSEGYGYQFDGVVRSDEP